MNTFMSNMTKNDVLTENGMPAHSTSDSRVLDLFFLLGTRPTKDRLIPVLDKAWSEDPTLTLKCLFQSRDIREGKGERESFRIAINHLANFLPAGIIEKIPEYGRWDDIYSLFGTSLEKKAIDVFEEGLKSKNALCAKWMDRKGQNAHKFNEHTGMTHKEYRKILVSLTNVVENKMCAREWQGINYSHVPSQASRIYSSAFKKHDLDRYNEWKANLAKPESGAKINVSTLYPHEIVAMLQKDDNYPVEQAWEQLLKLFPTYDEKILPVCDVSGSMIGLPMDVCIGLGIFLSQRNTGPFKDAFVTFSANPKLQVLSGNLRSRHSQLERAEWGMNTNLEAVFKLLAKAAEKAKQEDVPSTILIMSDMQFDDCVDNSANAFKMGKTIFKKAGLKMPNVVFWNLRDAGKNTLPVKADKSGAALVSGFSPSILKGILNSPSNFTPKGIMLDILNSPRYSSITV